MIVTQIFGLHTRNYKLFDAHKMDVSMFLILLKLNYDSRRLT